MADNNDKFGFEEINKLAEGLLNCNPAEEETIRKEIAKNILESLNENASSLIYFGNVKCTEEVFFDALGEALSKEKGYSPEKGTKFTTYLINLINSYNKRVAAEEKKHNKGTTVFSFSKYNIPNGAVIKCDKCPDTDLIVAEKTVTDSKGKTIKDSGKVALRTSNCKLTKPEKFTEIVKNWTGAENYSFGLRHFSYNGTSLDGIIKPDNYSTLSIDDENFPDAPDNISSKNKLPEEQFIVILADFISEIIKTKKLHKYTTGIYSFHLINYSRGPQEQIEKLNILSDRIFNPSDIGFINKMTTFGKMPVKDYINLNSSDFSEYATGNDLVKKTGSKELKEKAIYTYYNIKKSTLSEHLDTFKEDCRKALKTSKQFCN